MPIFGLAMFGSSKNRKRKLMTYLKPWRNSQSNICFYAKILIWIFGFLTWSWSEPKINLCYVPYVEWPWLSISTCEMAHKTRVTRHACDFYFLVFLCDLTLTLTFSGMTLILTQYPSEIFTSTLCKFELFAACLTDPTAQSVKTVFFYLWPDIDVTRDLYL